MFDPESAARDGVDGADVGGAVVGEDAFDGDPVAAEEAQGTDEEPGGRDCFLVAQDLGVGESAVVVDCDVDVFPADRAAIVAVAVTAARVRLSLAGAADAFPGAPFDSA